MAARSDDELTGKVEELSLDDQKPENEGKQETIPSAEEDRNRQAKGAEEQRESQEVSAEKTKGDSGEKGPEESVEDAYSQYKFDCILENSETTLMKGEDILLCAMESGMHPYRSREAKWPSTTIVVCLIHHSVDADSNSTQTIFIRQNMDRKHAEEKIINCIKGKAKSTQIYEITMYINYSPCNTSRYVCSSELQRLQQTLPDVQFHLRFSSFYSDIRRPFCIRNKCQHQLASAAVSKLAFEKLQELDAKPFQEEDWLGYIELLEEYNKHINQSPQDLHKIRFENYGEWRDWEDENMRIDQSELSIQTPQQAARSRPNTSGPIQREQRRPTDGIHDQKYVFGSSDFGKYVEETLSRFPWEIRKNCKANIMMELHRAQLEAEKGQMQAPFQIQLQCHHFQHQLKQFQSQLQQANKHFQQHPQQFRHQLKQTLYQFQPRFLQFQQVQHQFPQDLWQFQHQLQQFQYQLQHLLWRFQQQPEQFQQQLQQFQQALWQFQPQSQQFQQFQYQIQDAMLQFQQQSQLFQLFQNQWQQCWQDLWLFQQQQSQQFQQFQQQSQQLQQLMQQAPWQFQQSQPFQRQAPGQSHKDSSEDSYQY